MTGDLLLIMTTYELGMKTFDFFFVFFCHSGYMYVINAWDGIDGMGWMDENRCGAAWGILGVECVCVCVSYLSWWWFGV